MTHKLIKTDNYLLVVDDSEIKDCYYWNELDQEIRKNNNINHPYHKKIIAHLPLNGSPILEGVDLLPPIEDDVEEAERAFTEVLDSETKQVYDKMILDATEHGFIIGYNKAREKYKYTEEDVIRLIEKSRETGLTAEYLMLSSQYPTEFECEMESVRQPPPSRGFNVVPITVISAHGVEWVGEYK
jgi:hypothetical protein